MAGIGIGLRRIGAMACLAASCAMFVGPAVAAEAKADAKAEAKSEAKAESDPRCSRINQRQSTGLSDYRNRDGSARDKLNVVEKFHFAPKHQRAAMRGVAEPWVWLDLDYTLRKFPNHSKALYLIGYYAHTVSREHPGFFEVLERRPDYSPASCYFERALRFAPSDPNVWNTLGRLQSVMNKPELAVQSMEKVVKLAPGSASAHYNLGLAYFAAEQFDKSAAAARKAYSLGYRRQDLKRRLASKGHWE